MPTYSNGKAAVRLDRLTDWLVATILVTANILAANGFLSQMNRIVRASEWLDFKAYYNESS